VKPTLSKDGTKRVDMRFTVRLGTADFVNFLCLKYVEGEPEDIAHGDLELSRRAVLEVVRTLCISKGPDAPNWWRDDVDDDEWIDVLRKWAEHEVKRLFPEFY
jgi:hypothetical protein